MKKRYVKNEQLTKVLPDMKSDRVEMKLYGNTYNISSIRNALEMIYSLKYDGMPLFGKLQAIIRLDHCRTGNKVFIGFTFPCHGYKHKNWKKQYKWKISTCDSENNWHDDIFPLTKENCLIPEKAHIPLILHKEIYDEMLDISWTERKPLRARGWDYKKGEENSRWYISFYTYYGGLYQLNGEARKTLPGDLRKRKGIYYINY